MWGGWGEVTCVQAVAASPQLQWGIGCLCTLLHAEGGGGQLRVVDGQRHPFPAHTHASALYQTYARSLNAAHVVWAVPDQPQSGIPALYIRALTQRTVPSPNVTVSSTHTVHTCA